MKKAIIIGGGFAGITAALKLLKNGWAVTIFNPRAVFEFSPLLPDALIKNNPTLAEFSFAPLFNYGNFKLITEKVVRIDPAAKIVNGKTTALPYDYLLIVSGLNGKAPIPGSENGTLFKTVADVKKITQWIDDAIAAGKPVRTNIIGAGATGVETALALSFKLKKRSTNWQINLLHNRERPLGDNEWLSVALVEHLNRQKINFVPNQTIARLCPEGVMCGEFLHPGDLNILTAGGQANVDFCPPNFLAPNGQIKVNDFLQTIDKNIFAAGDVCDSRSPKTAQAAEYEGTLAAKNISASANGGKFAKNQFKTHGFLILTGPGRAAGNVGHLQLNGRLAGLARSSAYLLALPGIKNRLKFIREVLSA